MAAMDQAEEAAEKALFELEELKLRLAAGRCRDAATAARSAAALRGEAAAFDEAPEEAVEVLRRRVLELETALQLATLRGAESDRVPKVSGPSPAALAASAASAAAAAESRRTVKLEPGAAVFDYLTEKLDESLEDRRRFFERYLVVRELALARSQKEPNLPVLSDASRSLRDGRAPPQQVLAELEKVWLPSDQALVALPPSRRSWRSCKRRSF
ncbi:unnamed protein product [Durusdinium trenchii]|uniref:Uncharacterized protein n=1 Tax=Durusdinium trenchii TaxID=1381693 RepID=A0ABP0LI60_9DINO